jgi:hypothetical protein
MEMQLKVIKADGSVEEYFHTKIVGTINNALAESGQPDVFIAEHLADAVTFFLYRSQNHHTVTSGVILSIIKAVLDETGYEDSALALTEHHLRRKIKRSRIEVLHIDVQNIADIGSFNGTDGTLPKSRWDKSKIVDWLVKKHQISRHTARMIASMTEEKILAMVVSLVSTGLIKQLVLADAALVLRAQQQLQAV